MKVITLSDKHLEPTGRPHVFSNEASSLGWAPGVWPDAIYLEASEPKGVLGNGMPLRLTARDPDGTALYEQDNGIIEFRVFND